jgi:site-specific DNA recombinase
LICGWLVETVRTIFRRYLELRSFSKLVADLDRRGIVTKRRSTKVAKFNGGIPFTYGPLAYFLKNRIYIGEVHHGGKWFEGEHAAIVDRATFDRVQQLLATKANGRKAKRSESGALLMGKLYDDKGNLMSPSFSSKNGVRYRFYVSSALLRGRKALSGSVTRVSAQAIEEVTVQALRGWHPDAPANDDELVERHLLRAQLGESEIKLSLLELELLQPSSEPGQRRIPTSPDREIRIPWVRPAHSLAAPRHIGTNGSDEPNQKLVPAVVRAHRWADALVNAEFASLEQLAASVKLHPKVVRNEIRLAFLAPKFQNPF